MCSTRWQGTRRTSPRSVQAVQPPPKGPQAPASRRPSRVGQYRAKRRPPVSQVERRAPVGCDRPHGPDPAGRPCSRAASRRCRDRSKRTEGRSQGGCLAIPSRPAFLCGSVAGVGFGQSLDPGIDLARPPSYNARSPGDAPAAGEQPATHQFVDRGGAEAGDGLDFSAAQQPILPFSVAHLVAPLLVGRATIWPVLGVSWRRERRASALTR